MNRDRVQGTWVCWKGRAKEALGRLLHDDITRLNGKREQCVGRMQRSYGEARDRAARNRARATPDLAPAASVTVLGGLRSSNVAASVRDRRPRSRDRAHAWD